MDKTSFMSKCNLYFGKFAPEGKYVPVFAGGYLILISCLELVTGSIHIFAPDGGANSIAGLTLNGGSATIIFLFASIGIGQVTNRIFTLLVAIKFRKLVIPVLIIELLKGIFLIILNFTSKGPENLYPREIGNFFTTPLIFVIIVISLYLIERKPKT